MNNNWKVVRGDDGKEYYEVNTQIVVPYQETMSNADGVVMVVSPNIPPGSMYVMDSNQSGYNIEQLFAMRNGIWDTRLMPTDLSINVNRWLPGDPVEPEHPAGRFRNLDWDEAS